MNLMLVIKTIFVLRIPPRSRIQDLAVHFVFKLFLKILNFFFSSEKILDSCHCLEATHHDSILTTCPEPGIVLIWLEPCWCEGQEPCTSDGHFRAKEFCYTNTTGFWNRPTWVGLCLRYPPSLGLIFLLCKMEFMILYDPLQYGCPASLHSFPVLQPVS